MVVRKSTRRLVPKREGSGSPGTGRPEKKGLRVAAVSTVEAAHRIVAAATPAVILLEETSVAAESREHPGQGARLESAASALAAYAPVVVIGRAIHEGELAALVNGGLADFVARSGGCLPVALGLVEQRLLRAQKFSTFALPAVLLEDATAEAFGRSSGTNSTIR